MHKKLLMVFVLVVISGVAIYAFTFPNSAGRPPRVSDGDESVGCIALSDPVCGVDGTTYSNNCVATEQNGVAVAYRGECRSTTELTDDERNYLMWFLRERDAAGMQPVPVRHVLTAVSPSVSGSTFYTYEWDGGSIELEVNADGEVVGATDSAGVDYLSD